MRYLAVIATLLLLCACTSSGPSRARSSSSSATPVVVATIAVPSAEDLAVGDEAVWVLGRDFLYRLDASSGRVTARLAFHGHGDERAVAAAGRWVWISDPDRRILARIDATTNRITKEVPLAHRPSDLVAGSGAVWISADDGFVLEVDANSVRVISTLRVMGSGPLTEGTGAVFVLRRDPCCSVVRVDERTNRAARVTRLTTRPNAIAFGDSSVWVGGEGTVVRLDPQTDSVVGQVSVSGLVGGMTFAGSDLWVSILSGSQVVGNHDSVVRIAPARATVVGPSVEVGSGAVALGATRSAVWVANVASGNVTEIRR